METEVPGDMKAKPDPERATVFEELRTEAHRLRDELMAHRELDYEDGEGYITEDFARSYAKAMILRSVDQWDWDQIAEGADPDGRILNQRGCDKIAEALGTATVVVSWDE